MEFREMTTIDNKLNKVKGVGEEAATTLADMFDSYEQLAAAQPDTLIAIIDGLSEEAAVAAIAYAKIRSGSAGQQPASWPTSITLKTGRPADMTMRELVNAVADGERDSEVIAELRRRVRDRNVFVRESGGEKIDVTGTLEVMDHAEGTQPPQFWDKVPTETLDQILERRKAANPITGEALAKGDHWLSVSEERRLLAAYARLGGLLTGTEDEYTLVGELKKKTLGGRWERIQSSYERAVKSREALVDQARAELYVTRHEGRPGQMPPFGDAATGGNTPSPDWPKSLTHPQQLALIEGLSVFTNEELINVSYWSGVDHENLPYRQISAFRRELVLHHSRHSTIDKLFFALYKVRKTQNWLAVAQIDQEKAGRGDQVFGSQFKMTGDFRGAQINIGDKNK
jgi:hypothetical protein